MEFNKDQILELAKAMAKEMDKAEAGEKTKAELAKMQEEVKGLSEAFGKAEIENESLKNIIAKMDETINELSGAGHSVNKSNDAKEMEAFDKYLRTDSPSKELRKAINTTGAGNLIPQLLANEIIKDLKESSPFFADAKHYVGTRDSIDIPIRDSWTNAVEVVSEGAGVATKGSLTYSLLNIKATKLQSEVQLTDEMREDTDFDMQAEIREANVEDFAVTLSAAIEGGVYATNGFEGFTSNTTLTGAAVESETASTITADDLIDLEFSLNANYRPGSKYYMSRSAMKLAKKFKDENGQYLWQNPITLGTPATFNGYPVVECPDMDSVADGSYPVLFANMQKLYAIYLRKGMETEMDRYASEGMWNHITRMRVGGKVRNANAGVLLEVKSV
jgi:HK97 family phage major capsid protein